MASKPTKFAVSRYYDPTDLTESIALEVYQSAQGARKSMSHHIDIETLKHPEWAQLDLVKRETEVGAEVYTMTDRVLRLKFGIFEVIEHVDGQLTKVRLQDTGADIERPKSTDSGKPVSIRDDLDITLTAGDLDAVSIASSEPELNPAPVLHALVIDQSDNGTKQYGLYVCQDPTQPKNAYLIMSSDSLGEIQSYAKVTAAAILKKLNMNKAKLVATCIIHGKGVHILGAKGVIVRYEIVEGRSSNGMFVNEMDWTEAENRHACAKPESVAFQEDLQGKIPRMVALNMVPRTQKANADKTKTTPQSRKKKKKPQGLTSKTSVKFKKSAPKRMTATTITPAKQTREPGKADPLRTYCVCRMPDDGRELIACESGDDCPYDGWFHLACQNMTEFPEGDWWCRLCRQGHVLTDKDLDDVNGDSSMEGA
jgi:hypothetical protein